MSTSAHLLVKMSRGASVSHSDLIILFGHDSYLLAVILAARIAATSEGHKCILIKILTSREQFKLLICNHSDSAMWVVCWCIGKSNQNIKHHSKSFWTHAVPVLYSSVAPLKKRGSAASSIMTKSSSSSVTPTSMYSFTRLYFACSRAHWLPTFLHRQYVCVCGYLSHCFWLNRDWFAGY